MGRVGFAAVGVLAIAVAGCGGRPSTETLTAADVSNLPPGTAVGTELSGTYVIETGVIDACNCRVGPCSFFHAGIGEVVTVIQQDGALTIASSASPSSAITGGVNADGTYSCGGTDVPSYLTQGTQYDEARGKFDLSGGRPTGYSYQADDTVTGSGSGLSFDCDLHGSFSAVYQGP